MMYPLIMMVIGGFLPGFTKAQEEEPNRCPKSLAKGESRTKEDISQIKIQVEDSKHDCDLHIQLSTYTEGVEYARVGIVCVLYVSIKECTSS